VIYQKNEICALVADIATTEGLPPEFVLAIVDTLSSFNPALVEQSMDPQQYNPALSRQIKPNERLGLLQINPEAAKDIGYKQNQQELLEPTLNVQIGCRLLKKALEITQNNADRALLCVYGYSVSSLLPRIQAKVAIYKQFLALRPTQPPQIPQPT
jgi:soluble lytic murein transglycosylase-like protein